MHFHLKQEFIDSSTRKRRAGETDPTWGLSQEMVGLPCGSGHCPYPLKQNEVKLRGEGRPLNTSVIKLKGQNKAKVKLYRGKKKTF